MEGKQIALMPTKDEWAQIKEIATVAVKSRLLPDGVSTPEQAAIIALKGRELGLPPMVAFSHIHVIKGKPTMSAEIMLAHIYKDHPKAEINIEESSETKCVISAKRPGAAKLSTFTWTIERAQKMGLTGKDNWKKQPGTMLKWRAITEMKRTIFPEVLMGIDYTPEELEEINPTPQAHAPTQKDVTPKTSQKVAEIVDEDPKESPDVKPKNTRKGLKNHAPTPEEIAEKKGKARDMGAIFEDSDQEWKDLVQLCKDNQAVVPFEFFVRHIAENYGVSDYKTLTRQQLVEIYSDFEAIITANQPQEEENANPTSFDEI